MARAPRWQLAVALVVAVTAVVPAAAQDIQNFKPAVGTWNYFAVDGATVAEPGRFIPSLYLNYGRNPLVHRTPSGKIDQAIIEDLTMVDLVLAVGLHERVEVGLDVPFGYSAGGGDVELDRGAGLGDLRLMPKLILVGAGRATGFGLALASPLSFPTGDEDKGTSSRHFVANPKVILEFRASSFRLAANAGYRWRPRNRKELEPLTVGNGITFGGAAAVNLGGPGLQAIAEVFGTRYEDVAEDEGGPNPLEALAGMRLFNESGLVFTLGGGVGLIADYGAPEFRVLTALAWRPGDDAERPVVLAAGGAGDTDGDGVKDAADACIHDPEDRDGFEDVDGCPDLDNDTDGIADADDGCPLHGEDLDGHGDDDGCPDLDNDADGIADANDRCPAMAENRNGHLDEDGCPDAGDVVVHDGHIEIKQRVYFATDRHQLQPRSFPVLDQIAEVLLANPHIRRVRVEGHTDNWGDPGFNRWLSKKRAGEVVKYLLRKGVSPERLESVGRGSSEPIGDNRTEEGAALNRRVEFHIVERTDAPRAPVAAPAPPAPTPPPAEPPVASEDAAAETVVAEDLAAEPPAESDEPEAAVDAVPVDEPPVAGEAVAAPPVEDAEPVAEAEPPVEDGAPAAEAEPPVESGTEAPVEPGVDDPDAEERPATPPVEGDTAPPEAGAEAAEAPAEDGARAEGAAEPEPAMPEATGLAGGSP